MTAHTIQLPDRRNGANGALRTLVWDDEAGTVSGDYSRVDDIREFFRRPERWTAGDAKGVRQFKDPRHIPEDFKGMIVAVFAIAPDLPHIVWPPILADVTSTPLDPGPPPPPGEIWVN